MLCTNVMKFMFFKIVPFVLNKSFIFHIVTMHEGIMIEIVHFIVKNGKENKLSLMIYIAFFICV